jgi:hypothetical protein
MVHEEPTAPKTREDAFVNMTGVGRAYSICAIELRAALEIAP